MTFTLTLQSDSELVSDDLIGRVIVATQDAMAVAFSDIVLNNFGESGEDRPVEWPPIREQYAIEYHDGDRTPTLILSGDARSSIDVELGGREYSSCFSANDYLPIHQWGDPSKNIPARPVFPMNENGELTDYSSQKCFEAAERAAYQVLITN